MRNMPFATLPAMSAARRSPAGDQLWLNWVVRLADTRIAVGHVQATVMADGTAEIAYVIGSAWSGRGIATEATSGMIDVLASLGDRSDRR